MFLRNVSVRIKEVSVLLSHSFSFHVSYNEPSALLEWLNCLLYDSMTQAAMRFHRGTSRVHYIQRTDPV